MHITRAVTKLRNPSRKKSHASRLPSRVGKHALSVSTMDIFGFTIDEPSHEHNSWTRQNAKKDLRDAEIEFLEVTWSTHSARRVWLLSAEYRVLSTATADADAADSVTQLGKRGTRVVIREARNSDTGTRPPGAQSDAFLTQHTKRSRSSFSAVCSALCSLLKQWWREAAPQVLSMLVERQPQLVSQ